jgi:hypothetical protein
MMLMHARLTLATHQRDVLTRLLIAMTSTYAPMMAVHLIQDVSTSRLFATMPTPARMMFALTRLDVPIPR